MLGADDDQRIGPLRLDRAPHALVAGVEGVPHLRVGAMLAPRDARCVTANACEDETHDLSPAREYSPVRTGPYWRSPAFIASMY